jgi:outer membrane immunogenic protein
MKIKLLIAVASILVANSVIAQSVFQGAYVQLGIGLDQNSISSSQVSLSVGGGPVPNETIPSSSASSFSGVVGLGYNFKINDDFLLGVGADYGLVPSSAFNGGPSSDGFFAGTQTKISNRYNIFITPGYVIDQNKLTYLKVGYSSQTVKVTDLTTAEGTYGETIGSGSANGYVLGLGYKQMIAKGFYGFGEANYYSYSGASFGGVTLSDGSGISGYSPKTSAYQFLVGVGYKF